MQTTAPSWYDPTFLKLLERLRLSMKRGSTSQAGDLVSARRGGHGEFIEHRAYAPGDDLRQLDWNVLSRHNALHVKVFSQERLYDVSVLVDGSRSMAAGAPESKFVVGQKIAASVAFLALLDGNRTRVGLGCGPAELGQAAWTRDLQQRSGFFQALHFMAGYTIADGPPFAETLAAHARSAAARERRGGLVIVTDGYELEDLHAPLQRLAACHQQVTVVQVLGPDEVSPGSGLHGPLHLLDSETPATAADPVAIAGTDSERVAYAEALTEFLGQWRALAVREGIRHGVFETDRDLFAYLMREGRQLGLVRA